MAAPEGLIAAIDQVIAFFNAKKMDLPDGFFDRTTQFVINGAPFETLLGQSPDSPLILMLSRGPAGFRFTAKALQHAVPDARIERDEVVAGVEPDTLTMNLSLSGTLRGTDEAIAAVIPVTLRLARDTQVHVAEAEVEPAALNKIREARLRS
jgi:hypothetical protein